MTLSPPADGITRVIGSGPVEVRPLPPYSEQACGFLGALSAELLRPGAARLPDVSAFGFWCRPQNLARLKGEFEDGRRRLGLGLAFHITPANVPVNFAFSYALGVLAGNANLVRLPSRPFPEVDAICGALGALVSRPEHAEIARMSAFVRFDKNDKILSQISAKCRARIIWGSDETIRDVRRIPLPERSVELAFPDRYSLCVLDAPAVLKLNERELERLGEDFFNDTYAMDQNACSSPHLIIWHGPSKAAARARFWGTIERTVHKRYRLEPAAAIDNLTRFGLEAATLTEAAAFAGGRGGPYRVTLGSLPERLESLRGSCGYFYEYDSDDLSALWEAVTPRFQTLTYFGLDKERLADAIVGRRLGGIDRVVPVGRALEMSVVWDGFDVCRSLSRIVAVS